MRLTSKLSLVLTSAFALLLAIDVVIGVVRQTQFYESNTKQDLASQSEVLAGAISKLWSHYGRSGAVEVLAAANEPSDTVKAHFIDSSRFGATQELDAGELERLTSGEVVVDLHRIADGSLHARALAAVRVDAGLAGAVVLERKILSSSEVALMRAPRALTTLVLLIAVAALLSMVVGRRVVGLPVEALAAKAERAGRGDFTRPLALEQRDELGLLATALNRMCAELEQALLQVRRADRLMIVGQLAAGLAHELGTPINVVSERIKMAAAGEVAPADVPQNNQRMLDQLERMARIIRQVLDFARQRPPEKTDTDLAKLIGHVAEVFRPLAEKARVELAVEAFQGPATVRLDVHQIEQALGNLLMNAFQAMPKGGRVQLGLQREARGFCIEVRDQGTGIPTADVGRIFEPFFTTKGVGEGTGLGLSVVHGIIEEHGGRIDVESVMGTGSVFRVHLPAGGAQ